MKGKVASGFIILILLASFLSIHPLPTFAQPLQPVIGKVCSVGQPANSGLRFDRGRFTFCFTDKGAMWVTKANSNLNFSISPSTINLATQNFTLTKTLLRNSTTIDMRYSGSIAGFSASYDIILKNSSETYTKKISIIGSASVGGTIALPFKNPRGLSIISSATSYCIGDFCFDFSDASGFSPIIQNGALKFTVGPTFRIDPIWVDISGTNNCSSGTTCAVTITTSAVNTLLIFTSNARKASGHIIISSISGASLTWTARKQLKWDTGSQGSGKYYLEEWTAYWTSSGSITITATYNATIANAQIGALAILGSDHANNDFDTATLPTSGSGSGASPSITISTNNANDMIIGLLGEDSTSPSNTCTAGSGYFRVWTIGTTSNKNCMEDTFTMSTVTNKAVDYSLGDASAKWAMIADAIMEKPVVTTTTTTSTTTTTLSNITRPDPIPILAMGLGLLAVVFAFVFLRRR